MQTKFNYTLGNEFTLTGANFVGYYNVTDNKAYIGKYYNNSQALTNAETFATDLAVSEYYKDRVLLETIQLPYSKDDITVGINEIVTYQAINTKFNMLAANNNYVFSKLFVGDTDVPVSLNYTAGLSAGDNQFRWYQTPNYTALTFSALSSNTNTQTNSAFDTVKQFVVKQFENKTGYSIIAITSTNLIGLTSNAAFTDIAFVLNSPVYSKNSELQCMNLQNLAIDGDNVYVTDSTINRGQVFKYYAPGFSTGDIAYAGNLYFDEPIGGIGDAAKQSKFNAPTVVCAGNNIVAVADSLNNCIKVYDTQLVWKKTVTLSKTLNFDIKDIKHRLLNNNFYVLAFSNETNNYYFTEYDSQFNQIKSTVFQDALTIADVQFNKLAISEQDSNVFYVTTNSTVYKKFFTKPENTFAIYKREKLGQNPLHYWNTEYINWELDYFTWNYGTSILSDFIVQDIAIISSEENFDSVFLLSNSRILQITDKTNYNTVLTDNNFVNYSADSVNVNQDEYVQAVVVNKELYKLYDNITQLKNNIRGRFYGVYDGFSVLQHKNYSYLTNDELQTISINDDFNIYINDNEQVSVGVINRVLSHIYNIQTLLLDLTQANVVNVKTSITNDNILVID